MSKKLFSKSKKLSDALCKDMPEALFYTESILEKAVFLKCMLC